MLKITVQEMPEARLIKLEGRIAGPWVEELKRVWASLASVLDSKKLSLDLREVTFADPAGRQLLSEIYSNTRADFLADTPMTKFFAEEAMRGRQSVQQEGA
ncbi:MAG TPA: hypothetical protein VEU31_02405 [Candidatus Acidoferrales bacterium]|nr:hypothetical protein [Candidatus Acidoferrales bacterium]